MKKTFSTYIDWTNLPNSKFAAGSILIILFAFSVAIRIPNLDRPLSGNHEWLTSTVLRHQQIWHEAGIQKYNFSPIMTYANNADKNISNHGSVQAPDGSSYYMSYPPFAYIAPYLLFEALGIYPDVLPLQMFNIVCHFISGFLIFLIISLLSMKQYSNRLNIPAIVGFIVYIFSPETMWFQSNVYMADMFVQPFFIGVIYLLLRLMINNKNSFVGYVVLAVANFFMVYTEWIGLFLDFSFLLWLLLKCRRQVNADLKKTLLVLIMTAIAAVTLTFWQYCQVTGFDALITTSVNKYIGRSGLIEGSDGNDHFLNIKSWKFLFNSYLKGYFIFLIAIPFCLYYFNKLRKENQSHDLIDNQEVSLTLFLSFMPVLMHHLIFFNFTSHHSFSILKSSVIIAILLALLYHRFIIFYEQNVLPRKKIIWINIFIVLTIVISMSRYVSFVKGTMRNEYKNIGQYIQKTAESSEVVFIKPTGKFDIPPQIIFYAQRNIAGWTDEKAAKELIEKNGMQRGVIFVLNKENKQVTDVEYIMK